LQVLERRGRKDEALQVYEQAFAVDPESPMVAFRRAKALASMDRFDVRRLICHMTALASPLYRSKT
jgi:predicted Zn-dependent protease